VIVFGTSKADRTSEPQSWGRDRLRLVRHNEDSGNLKHDEVFMENSQLDPNQPISVLTVANLEALLTKVVQKVIRQELISLKYPQLQPKESPAAHPLENFIEKFGAWEDERTTEEIIKNIYESRIVSSSESML
jgi:hypothetical protein